MQVYDNEAVKSLMFQRIKDEVSRMSHGKGRDEYSFWAEDNFDSVFSDQLTDDDIIELVEVGDWPLSCEFVRIASVRSSERYDSFCARLSKSLRLADGGFEMMSSSTAEGTNVISGVENNVCLADCVAHEYSGDCSRVSMCVFHLLTAYMHNAPERFFALLGDIPYCDVMYSLVHAYVSMVTSNETDSAIKYIKMIQIPAKGSLVPFVMLFRVLFDKYTQKKNGDDLKGTILSLFRYLIDSCKSSGRQEYAVVMAAWLIRLTQGKAVFDTALPNENLLDGLARSVMRLVEDKIKGWNCAANDPCFMAAFGIDNWLEDLSVEKFRTTGICSGEKRNLQLYFITLSSLGLEISDKERREYLLGSVLSSSFCEYWRAEKFSILAICMANVLPSCADPGKIYASLVEYCDQSLNRLRFAHSDQNAFSIEERIGLLVETGICAVEVFLNAQKLDICEEIFRRAWKISVNMLYVSILPKRMVDYVRYLFVYRVKLALAQNAKVDLSQLLNKLPRPILSVDHVDDCVRGCLESLKLNFPNLTMFQGVDDNLYLLLQGLEH